VNTFQADSVSTYQPDKVHIQAFYDEHDGSCHSLEISLNYDGISREDLMEVIRAAVHPGVVLADMTQRNRELGQTGVLRMPSKNGSNGASGGQADSPRIGR
jgi:hypothetical protein